MIDYLKVPFSFRHRVLIGITIGFCIGHGLLSGTALPLLIGIGLSVWAVIKVRRYANRRQEEGRRLRQHHFVLDDIRNPADEGARLAGTAYPTTHQMVEALARAGAPLPADPANAQTVSEAYESYFRQEYRVSFRYGLDSPCMEARSLTLPYGSVARQPSPDGRRYILFPGLQFHADTGTICYGPQAILFE